MPIEVRVIDTVLVSSPAYGYGPAFWAAVATFMVSSVTLYLTNRRVKLMREQIKASATIALFERLENANVRQARTRLMSRSIPYHNWEEDAALVLAAYNLAGVLLQNGLVNENTVLQQWGYSLRRMTTICAGFKANRETPENADPIFLKNGVACRYFGGLDHLFYLVRRRWTR